MGGGAFLALRFPLCCGASLRRWVGRSFFVLHSTRVIDMVCFNPCVCTHLILVSVPVDLEQIWFVCRSRFDALLVVPLVPD